MNPKNKRRLLQSDLSQALKTINSTKLKTKIASSNISKLKKLTTIQMMISELTKLYFQCQQSNSLNTFFQSLNFIVQHQIKNITENVFIKYGDHQKYLKASNDTCYCKQLIKNEYAAVICLSCNKFCHKICISNPELNSVSQCPQCFIKTMDPFYQVKQVVFSHVITLRQKCLDIEIDLSKVADNQQVQLRCIKIDPNPFYNSQISWPDNCILKVNNIEYLKLKPLQINTAAKRREDKSVDLPPTQYRRKTKIQMKIQPYYNGNKQFRLKNCSHFFAVVIIQKNNVSDLIVSTLKHIPNQTIYRCALIQRFNKNNKWITTQKEKINVNCPFSKDRIQIPVRGVHCVHLQCFDLKNFLTFNKITKLYKCPIFCCSQRCHNLIVDPIIMKIINNNNMVESIEFSEQGQNILNKSIQQICISSDQENLDKLSRNKKSILIQQASKYQLSRLKLKKPKVNTSQQLNKQSQVKQGEVLKEREKIVPFTIIKQNQLQINNYNLQNSTINIEDCVDYCPLTSIENTIQPAIQQKINESDSNNSSNNVLQTKINQINIQTSSKIDGSKPIVVLSQKLVQIKDSDDEDFQQKIQRRIQQQKIILNEQRKIVQKKCIDFNIYDICILNKHFLRLVLNERTKQSALQK